METRLLRILAVLGIPGVALGIFYLLLRAFNFKFAQIDPGWTAIIAIMFLLVVGGVTAFALHLWRPTRLGSSKANDSKVMVLQRGEETVALTELMRSIGHDVVKVAAHTHELGVEAEYEWKRQKYPNSQVVQQRLVEMDVGRNSGGKAEKVYFDILDIKLSDGRTKELYFDISAFFSGGGTSITDPDSFIGRKIRELYQQS